MPREITRTAGTTAVLEQRTRALTSTDAHLVRVGLGDEEQHFTGHAALYDSRTAIGNPLRWGFYEEIAPGAFDKTLAEGDARFLVDHDSRLLVARTSAGDLRLASDDVGLAVDADLDLELTYVRDLARNLEKRRITGMSFGFYVIRDEWTTVPVEIVGADGKDATVDAEVRRLLEIRLLEVSAVTFPAYEDTDAGLRAVVDEVRAARGRPTDHPRDLEGGAPAPAETTRENTTPAPAETTQGLTRLGERAHALAVRYGQPTGQ